MSKYLDTSLRLLDPHERTLEPAIGDRGMIRAKAVPASLDEENRTLRFVCSTGTLDRWGEIVDPAAIAKSIELFADNPAFLAGHQHVGMAGEPTTIGYWSDFKITDAGFEATAHFMTDDDLAERYWQRYVQGAHRAVSIGFLVRAWEMRDIEDEEEKTRRVRVFTDIELLEISAVAVPANPDALVKSGGSGQRGAGDDAGGEPFEIELLDNDTLRRFDDRTKRDVQQLVELGLSNRQIEIIARGLRPIVAMVLREMLVPRTDQSPVSKVIEQTAIVAVEAIIAGDAKYGEMLKDDWQPPGCGHDDHEELSADDDALGEALERALAPGSPGSDDDDHEPYDWYDN